MWLEHLAVQHPTPAETYPFPFVSDELDFRPLLEAVICDRLRGRRVHEIARTFHKTLAQAIREAATRLCVSSEVDTIVLSGGVFQNQLLMRDLKMLFRTTGLQLWTNHLVPPNDGGISLGQAAIAAYANEREMNELPRLEQVVTLM